MNSSDQNQSGRTLAVLHPAFALTGMLHAMGGPLLPSLASTFQLSDTQSGSLFLLYFAGVSLGALLCTGNYGRLIAYGFAAVSATCLGITVVKQPLLAPLFLLLGVSVGVPMSAVSMFAGKRFAAKSAAPLTFLNFSWSGGALLAPLFAAQLLVNHNFRAIYGALAVMSAVAAAASWLLVKDAPEQAQTGDGGNGATNLRLIALFAFVTFLEVGIENTTITWLATYAHRSSGMGTSAAAATSSLYWCGFLASRGFSSLVLLRAEPMRVLSVSIVGGLVAAFALVGLPGTTAHAVAMVALGVALAPIFPLMLSRFFARARRASDSRWVLAVCGFGGSVLPWLTGLISGRSGSLRAGLLTVPAALLVIALMLPAMGSLRSPTTAD